MACLKVCKWAHIAQKQSFTELVDTIDTGGLIGATWLQCVYMWFHCHQMLTQACPKPTIDRQGSYNKKSRPYKSIPQLTYTGLAKLSPMRRKGGRSGVPRDMKPGHTPMVGAPKK